MVVTYSPTQTQDIQAGDATVWTYAKDWERRYNQGVKFVTDYLPAGQPDGVTDNSSGIQDAIDAAEAAGGTGTIYFPRGTYIINTKLVNSGKNIRLVGPNHNRHMPPDYEGAVLKAGDSIDSILHLQDGAFSTTVDSLIFDGNSLATYCIQITQAGEQTNLIDLFVINAVSHGIWADGTDSQHGVHMIRGRIRSNGGSGLKMTDPSAAGQQSNVWYLERVHFSHNGADGATIAGSDHTLINCQFDFNDLYGLRLGTTGERICQEPHIINCFFEGNNNPGSQYDIVNENATRVYMVSNQTEIVDPTGSGIPRKAALSLNSGGFGFWPGRVSDEYLAIEAGASGRVDLATHDSSGTDPIPIILIPQGSAETIINAELEINGDLNHDGSNVGFYGTTPVAQQTGVAVSAAAIHAALVNLGLITA